MSDTTTTTIVVHTEADLDNAIEQIDKSSGQTFCVQLQPTGGQLTLTQDMPLLTAGSNTVTIDGGGSTLDGAGQFRGFFVESGNVTFQNLTIQNALAEGGAGGDGLAGGGGGAGLGGGLFVGQDATVSINNVAFDSDAAIGGAGGSADANDAAGGGGGGLGGDGGAGGVTEDVIATYPNGETDQDGNDWYTTSYVTGGGGGGGIGATTDNPSWLKPVVSRTTTANLPSGSVAARAAALLAPLGGASEISTGAVQARPMARAPRAMAAASSKIMRINMPGVSTTATARRTRLRISAGPSAAAAALEHPPTPAAAAAASADRTVRHTMTAKPSSPTKPRTWRACSRSSRCLFPRSDQRRESR